MFKHSLFIFRQDLRIFDNKGLIHAIKNSQKTSFVFIFDEKIIDSFWWFEDKKFLFLKESLNKLWEDLREKWWHLFITKNTPLDAIKELYNTQKFDNITVNKSYWNYWKKRDEEIKNFIEERGGNFSYLNDFLLNEPEEIPQRKVFTPFYKLWKKHLETKEIKLEECPEINWNYIEKYDYKTFLEANIKWDKHKYFTLDFWRNSLENFNFEIYDDFRNDLDKKWTSRLSVYIRFGIFSIREVYLKALGRSESYVSELAWREFWQHIDYYFPETKKIEFQERKRLIKWRDDEENFEKWCKGETWYPVVDACIKQLLETNYMHWRGRMIVASFLTKDLLIDWRKWEKFFKKHLLDYDENVNFWNWQWSASVWADPKPLRIFNPCLQSEKFDRDAIFIKKYLPEVEKYSAKEIHNPMKFPLDYAPLIVDHSEAQRRAREAYKTEII